MPSSSYSSLTCTKFALWTIAAVILQITGHSLFVLGYFPIKPALSGVSDPESYRDPMCGSVEDPKERAHLPPEQLRSVYQEMSQIPPSFDRLVLMVVDGLPAEFVLGKGDQPPTKVTIEGMPYTQSLLSNETAIGFHSKAAPPTVTMPRLKAMVSGAVGGFLDVAFNFNTQALLDDNLLGQFFNIGWNIVMLVDETWTKLFPGLKAGWSQQFLSSIHMPRIGYQDGSDRSEWYTVERLLRKYASQYSIDIFVYYFRCTS